MEIKVQMVSESAEYKVDKSLINRENGTLPDKHHPTGLEAVLYKKVRENLPANHVMLAKSFFIKIGATSDITCVFQIKNGKTVCGVHLVVKASSDLKRFQFIRATLLVGAKDITVRGVKSEKFSSTDKAFADVLAIIGAKIEKDVSVPMAPGKKNPDPLVTRDQNEIQKKINVYEKKREAELKEVNSRYDKMISRIKKGLSAVPRRPAPTRTR